MAAFYRSVEATSQYIYGLGVNLEDYLFIEGDEGSNVKFFSWLEEEFEDNGLFKSSPYESRHPWISEERKCPSTVIDEPDSWLIYIPFDTCGFRLGDSLLTQVNGHNGGKAPDINDPDYFIDCYEVVRELVEDEVVVAGVNVADGGLITAAQRMCGKLGIDMDISGIISSYQNDSRSRILFGEVPGIIMQISGENYDYVDSQLLLQDVAYYTIGQVSSTHKGLKITNSSKSDLADILASLIRQTSEGED